MIGGYIPKIIHKLGCWYGIWIADEFKHVAKRDSRLKRRCIKLVPSVSANAAGSIYASQHDASDLKARYRFFGHQRMFRR